MFVVARAARCILQPGLVSAVRCDVRPLSLVVRTNGKLLQGIDTLRTEIRTVQEGNAVPPKASPPLTPYLQFLKENMAKFRKENPGKSAPALSKLVAVAYKALPEADRKQLSVAYVEQRDKYRALVGPPVKLTTEELIQRYTKRIRSTKLCIARLAPKLNAPRKGRKTVLNVYVSEHFKRVQAAGSNPSKREDVMAAFVQAVRAFKEIPAEERERLRKGVEESNQKDREVYQRWLKQLEADAKDTKVSDERKKQISTYFMLHNRLKQLKRRIVTLRNSLQKRRLDAEAEVHKRKKATTTKAKKAASAKRGRKPKKAAKSTLKKKVKAEKKKTTKAKAAAKPKVRRASPKVTKKKTTKATDASPSNTEAKK